MGDFIYHMTFNWHCISNLEVQCYFSVIIKSNLVKNITAYATGCIVDFDKAINSKTDFNQNGIQITKLLSKTLEYDSKPFNKNIIEPRHEKTNVLHMRKQRRRSALR